MEPNSQNNQQTLAKRYHRLKRSLSLAEFAVSVAVLIVLLASGWTHSLRDWAFRLNPQPAGALVYYLLALVALTQALTLPLQFTRSYVLEHRFGLSRLRLGGWLKDWLKGLALSLALAVAGVEVVYWGLRHFPETWWLLCATVFVLFFLLLTKLAPVILLPLFFKFQPLEDEDLKQRLLRLSARVSAAVTGVWLWKLGEKTRKANAALVGWGKTRRILLADTLLEVHTADEIEVILAHELAHYVRHDLWKGLTMQTALTFAGFYVVHVVLRQWGPRFGFHGLADFANLPLLSLVGGVASLVVLPLVNAFSRSRERGADKFALRVTHNRAAFISGMEKLAQRNLAEPKPHRVIELIFYSHPPVEKRIRYAAHWQPGSANC